MTVRHTTNLLGAFALLLLSAAHVGAQTTVIIDDSFADGTRTADGPLQGDFYTSSSLSAIEVGTDFLGLVSGSSGRTIHGIFDEQTLVNAGDMLTTQVTFTTPATGSRGGDDFRLGIFDHNGRIGGDATMHLDTDQSFSSSNLNPLFNGLDGVFLELDIDPPMTEDTDLRFRRSDPSQTGRFLSTTSGYTSLRDAADPVSGSDSGPNIGYEWSTGTEYTVQIMSTLNAAGGIDHTGTYIDETNSIVYPSWTVTDVSPGSTTFGMLAVYASSDAFGSSNTPGEEDNGIDISNVLVEFKAVPEPSSAILCLGALAAGLCLIRRR